jgi:hypothetical protein
MEENVFFRDQAETFGKKMHRLGKHTSGMSTFHWLTIGSIAASVALYAAGKKHLALFVGLWPPTFQALKSSLQK